LGCGVLAAIGYEAYGAVRSHRHVVDAVLRDYARVAAWNYRNHAQAEFNALLEHLFHVLHGVGSSEVRRRAVAVEAVQHRPHEEQSCAYRGDIGEISTAIRFSLAGEVPGIAGTSPSAADLSTLQEAVATAARDEGLFRGREGLVGVELSDGPHVAAFSRQFVERDTLLYTLLMEPQSFGMVLDRAFRFGQLLPTPLVTGLRSVDLLAVRVDAGQAGQLFRSSAAFPTEYVAQEWLGRETVQLRAAVGIWPDAAQHLVIGGLPRSRLTVMLVLLIFAMLLLGTAFMQLRREHELAALRAGFVSSVSHELRTPLALQRVFIDTMKLGRAEKAKDRAWALANLDRETSRLTHVVENVLRFSQTERGTIKVTPTPVDLVPVLTEIMADYRTLLADGEATLSLHAEEPSHLAGVDVEGVRQVLFNLLENAVRYGPRGQEVVVSVRRNGRRVQLTVDDAGLGVPRRERERIWEAYERGEAGRVSGRGGSGIGLSVVREIIELHNGTVAVEDAPAGGARFRIELPAAGVNPPTPMPNAVRDV
jgi:signal transduction histidine kinase